MAFKEKFTGYHITEREVRYAVENTRNNAEAANFLHVSYRVWKKYASMVKDPDSGLSLFELHRKKTRRSNKTCSKLDEILEGKYPAPNRNLFREALFHSGILAERCTMCGFDEHRLTDFKTPILIAYLDGDIKNGKLENLDVLCYNCYFLTVGNINMGTSKIKFELDE